ncbi:MAG TPA: long-chain-acyl-CoA synthetase, partial [Aldersonia sp.]
MTTTRIGLGHLATRLPKLLPDVTTMAAGGLGLLLGPDTRQSIGLMFQRLADRHPDRPFLK